MSQEEKQLLLQDICARLPFGVICDRLGKHYPLIDIDIKRELVYLLRDGNYVPYSILRGDIIQPYLRPMSKMTDEEKAQVQTFMDIVTDENYGDGYSPSAWDAMNGFVQYCDSHYLDHRGLIFRGIALEAPEGMY